MSWRTLAKLKIDETVLRVGLEDPLALRKALFDAYPFGERRYYPYKVWCEEVRKIMAFAKGSEPTNFPLFGEKHAGKQRRQ